MKLNKNILKIKEKDELFLYNLINGGIIKIPNDCYDISNFLNNLNINDLKLLREQLYLDTDVYENPISEVIKNIRNEMKYSDKYASFTIHLGYDCNMSCSYCYQNNINEIKRMDDDTLGRILDFFKNVKNFNNLEVIDVTFIGGEPLLYTNLIEKFINNCNSIFDGIEIKYSLVTNGLLMTESTLQFLEKINWDFIQITIDGSEKYHDSLRQDKNGNKTFTKIIRNLEYLQNMNLPVVINCNINSHNYYGINELLELLKNKNIYFPVCYSLIFDDMESKVKKYENNAKENENIWFKAHEEAKKFKYTYKPFYRMPYMVCGLQRINVFNISPDGKIYKCISGMEESKYYLSKVEDYMTQKYVERLSQFVEMPILKSKCKKCNMEVVCGGGCEFKNSLYGDQCIPKVLLKNEMGILKDYVKTNYDHKEL